MTLIPMLFAFALPVRAQATSADLCKPPFGSIVDCPSNYMPHPVSKPPTKGEIDGIENLITIAKAKLQEEKRKRDLWAERKAAVDGLKQDQRNSPEAKTLIARYDNAAADLRKAKAETQAAFNAAIVKAEAVYHLEPPVKDNTKDPRLAGPWQAIRPWGPRFSEDEIEDPATHQMRRRTQQELDDEQTKLNARTAGLGMALAMRPHSAITDSRTGQILLFDNAFDSPDDLATIIAHETVHWIDTYALVSEKLHTPAQRFDVEARAYGFQGQLASSLKMKGAQSTFDLAKRYSDQAVEAKRLGLTDEILLTNPIYSNWLPGSVVGSLDAIRRDADSLRKSHERHATSDSVLAQARGIAAAACSDNIPTQVVLDALLKDLHATLPADPYSKSDDGSCQDRVFRAVLWRAFEMNVTSIDRIWLHNQVHPVVVDYLSRARSLSAEACQGQIPTQSDLDALREGLLEYLPSHPYVPSKDTSCENAILLAVVDKAFWSNSIGEDWLRARVAQAKADAVAPHNWLEAQQALGALAQAACDGKTLDQDTLDRAMGYVTKYPQSMGWAANDVSCYRVIMGRMSELALSGNSIWADWVAWKVDHLDTETRQVQAPAQGGSSTSGSSGYQGSSSHDFSHAHDIANRIPNFRF